MWLDRVEASVDAPAEGRLWWLWLPLATAVILAAVPNLAPQLYGRQFAGEQGVVELAQFAVMLGGIVLAAALLARRPVRRHAWLAAWSALALVGCVYVAGEEVSWGQHLVGWATPEAWQRLNDQGETNLHNTTAWLDQKPKLILEIAVLGGGLLLPLWPAARRRLEGRRLGYLLPSVRCVPAAALVLLARLEDAASDLFDTGLLLFYRTSEINELFMYVVVVIYLHDLHRRVAERAPPR
jgi:hypothetical protein